MNPSDKEDRQLIIKRKWQIALRRYVMEGNPSATYAPYFGLPADDLRKWIELQFTQEMSWGNFGERWNLSQRVPSALFDLNIERHLRLCWHFTNIVVQDQQASAYQTSQTLISSLTFFKFLIGTGVNCQGMVEFLDELQSLPQAGLKRFSDFLQKHKERIENVSILDEEDLLRLNKGDSLELLLAEKELIRKYGA